MTNNVMYNMCITVETSIRDDIIKRRPKKKKK